MKITDIVLTESMDDMLEMVLRQPFFKHNPVSIDNVLVHYTEYPPRGGFETRKLIPRTRARDTSSLVHNHLNHVSRKELGIAVRSETLFTYCSTHGNQGVVEEAEYGDRYVVIPKGDYVLYHNPGVHDFTDKFQPHFAPDKFSFVVSMIRRVPQKTGEVVKEITNLMSNVVDDEDGFQKHKINSFASDLTYMIDHDFTHLFKSEELHTLREEMGPIVEWLVDTVIFDHGYDVDNDKRKKIVDLVKTLAKDTVIAELEKFETYVKGIESTNVVKPFSNDEYMLACKEFFIFDHEEFFQYLRNNA